MDIHDLFPKKTEITIIPRISYFDGSANAYYLHEESLQYDPVSPLHSNTGQYSGGPPATVTINKEQFEAIQVACQTAILQTEDHLTNRPKGSGCLKMERTKIVLKMNSTYKKTIEVLLRKALGRSE